MASAKWLAPVLIFAACSSAAAPIVTATSAGLTVLTNQGGTLEGHTPRGFAGMGTGLFVGDNLNPNFPDGDGVQLFVSFEPTTSFPTVSSAVLSSTALTVRGTPFEDLGDLSAERVAYDAFGPSLFNLEPASSTAPCIRVGTSGITCDVTDLVPAPINSGDAPLQFRIRFDKPGDRDGQADLAMFFITDSNTNESGIFMLTIDG